MASHDLPRRVGCDIFCRVIDHLGDAGVTWRLARQLALEFGWRVRLLIDDPSPIPLFTPTYRQLPIEILRWDESLPPLDPADVVIEAFACDPPPGYIARMKGHTRPPVWINLEYLSAEGWIVGCHGLPSPQPGGLVKYFFFPGFMPGTGGLLRERTLALSSAQRHGEALTISLFCYGNPALADLLAAWTQTDSPIVCQVASGLPQQQVQAWLGEPFESGARIQRGPLTLVALPFLSQEAYDQLLASCDLNFVRGEDSFVRAQWMEKPFVWQAYPQEGRIHLKKLEAFLSLYEAETAVSDFFFAWNGVGRVDWPRFAAYLPVLSERAAGWAKKIASPGDLASNLVDFCLKRL